MRKLLLLFAFAILNFCASAQIAGSLKNNVTLATPLTLQCAGGGSARSGLAYNPALQLYYSGNAGLNTYPLETFNSIGTQVNNLAAGYDIRGLWYNTILGQLEANQFGGGLAKYTLNGSGYPTTPVTTISGANQPDAQAVGAFDPDRNEIIYLYPDRTGLRRVNRTTNVTAQELVFTGLPVAASNLNSTSVLYTGIAGQEYALLDYSNSRVYVLNTSGAYVATCQLPSIPITNVYGVAYANKLLWLFDANTKKWNSYDIFIYAAPAAPATPTASAPTLSSFNLSWLAVTDALSYNLDVATDAGFTNIVSGYNNLAVNSTSQIVSGLASGQIYYYRLRSTNGFGSSANSAIGSATTQFVPPGNALQFNKTNDRVTVPFTSGKFDFGTGDFSVETWVNTTQDNISLISDYSSSQGFSLNIGVGYPGMSIGGSGWIGSGQGKVNDGRWHHIAATISSGTLRIYLDGSLATTQPLSRNATPATNLTIGTQFAKMDEVKIYNVALTAANILYDMKNAAASVPGNLVAYYNFDQGTAGADNTGLTTLYDQSANALNGTLNNFTLNGTTSNWIDSYAIIVPTATAATAINNSSFTANWTSPATGTVGTYSLDYSTSSTFASAVTTIDNIPAASFAQVINNVKPGTVYYYRIRAVNGTDIGGNSNAVSATTTTPIPPGNALDFSAPNNYVSIGTAASFDATTMKTIEAWVKFKDFNGTQEIISKSVGSKGLELIIYNNNLSLYAMGGGSDQFINYPVSNLELNRWYHLAATQNGPNSTMTLYVNGIAVGTGTTSAGMVDSGQPLMLGTWAADNNRHFTGIMDEVRVWAVVRTQIEIANAMNAILPGTTPNLLAYYNFDHGTASGTNTGITTLYSRVGSTNDGTLNGFALTGTTSNWVGSYAAVVPIPLSAGAPTNSSITARWSAPSVGTVGTYSLVYSTSATFTSDVNTISGISAATTSQVVSNLKSGTTYYYRIYTINGAENGAYSSTITTATTTLAPPGNALALDPSRGNYVTFNTSMANFGTGNYTLEAWVKVVPGVTQILLSKRNVPSNGVFTQLTIQSNGFLSFELDGGGGNLYTSVTGNTIINDNKWHHVAAVRSGMQILIYVDGNLDAPAKAIISAPNLVNNAPFRIGTTALNPNFMNGIVDEVKIYNTDLTAANIQTDMRNAGAVIPGNLVAYYNFDQGTANGTNTGIVTLYDQSPNGNNGSLNNFQLTGTTSNWVGSYALSVPTATAATTPTNSSFTATWTAPAIGTANSYRLDVATDAAFTNILSAYNSLTVNGLSTIVTNLKPLTTYYYRVRAYNNTLGEGAPSNSVNTATTALAPPGNSLSFTGAPFVDLGTGVDVGTNFTEEAWIYSTSADGAFHGILGANDASRGPFLYVYQNNQIHGGFGTASGLQYYITNTPGGVIKPNTWNHLAQTFDGTNLILYVNGVEANRINLAGQVPNQTFVKYIGRMDNYFQGNIDEVRLWNVVRTPAQIQSSYNQILPATTPGLVAYYNFDHGTANATNTGITTLYDQTSGAKNGTLTSFALTGTSSNWVGSYAIIAPTALAASLPDQTSFTAKWTAPALGTVSGYNLEVATDAAFTNVVVSTNNIALTSQVVVGLTANTNYYYRVRAVNGTQISGTSNVINVKTIIATPPGNALDFAGAGSNYVAVNSSTYPAGTSSYTIEAWINPTNLTLANAVQSIVGWGGYGTNNATNVLRLGSSGSNFIIHNYWYGNDLSAVIPNIGGKWSHITATYDQPTNTRSIYLNGQLVASETVANPTHTVTSTNITIGASFSGNGEYFNGKIDEVRVYNTALSPANIQADMVNTSAAVPANLIAYYNFDQGIGNGNNTGIVSLRNSTPATNKGTLTNFTKTGAVSNFVGPNTYAVETPVATAATNVTTNGLSANWNAIVAPTNAYYFDVASDLAFGNILASYNNQNAGNVLTSSVTGLTAGSTYYYRVRANNEFDGRSASSNIISTTINKIDQNITVASTDTKVYGTADYTITASSGNGTIPLTYTSSNTAVATIDNTGSVHVVSAGSTVITVSQSANASYNAAIDQIQTLTITAKAITVTAMAGQSKIYGASDPILTYSNTALVGTDAFTGALTRDPGENVGSYAITQGTLALNASYTLTYVGDNFAVTAAPLTVTATGPAKAYGQALTTTTGAGNFTYSATQNGEVVNSVTLTPDAAGANATTPANGTYVVTPSGASGSNGFLASNYAITYVPYNGSVGVTAQTITFNSLSNATYGDAPITLTATSSSGLPVSYSSSNTAVATISGNTLTVVGQGSTVITATQGGNANYTAATAQTQNFTVSTKALTVSATAGQTKVYGAANPVYTYTSAGLVAGDAFSGALSRAAGENVGTAYAINQGSLTAGANYTITYNTANFSITAKPVTVTATAGQTKVYGSADPVFAYISTPLVNGDAFSGSLTRTAGENIGTTYAINQGSLTAGANYTITYVPANFSITAKPVTVTATAGQTKVYGAANPVYTYTSTALVAGDTFTGALMRTGGENVGTGYAINQGSLTAGANYTITYNSANFNITAKPIAVTADVKTKVYGSADPALTYTFTPALVSGDAFTGALSRTAGENVGTYAINKNTLALSSNYSLTYTGANLNITPKALTITADNKVKFQGTGNPALTASYSGFISGEGNTNLLTQPVLTTTATNLSTAGTYPIVVNGATSNNYAITFVNGTLTVTSGIPTSLTLAAAQLFENRPSGTLAGTLSSTSDDPGATFTYTLVPGTGSTDNAAFSISGNQLVTAQSFDFETKNSYSVRVRTTTQYGLSLEQTFTISVNDVNEAPTLNTIADAALCTTAATQSIALTGISAGPETAQSTVLSVTSNNAALFNSLSVSGTGSTGTLSYQIKPGASGVATITVTVQDNGGTANGGTDTFTRTFNLTIYALPTPSIASDKGDQVSKGETIKLTATGGTSYVWANANGIISGQNTATLTVRPSVTTTYTVTATNANGCSQSSSFTITVLSDFAKLKITNLLTPNGDGYNDKWTVENIDLYPNNEVKVFDKAGKLVYSKKGYDNSWDGSFNGSPLAENTYYYIIDFGPNYGKLKGFVTIVRE